MLLILYLNYIFELILALHHCVYDPINQFLSDDGNVYDYRYLYNI